MMHQNPIYIYVYIYIYIFDVSKFADFRKNADVRRTQ